MTGPFPWARRRSMRLAHADRTRRASFPVAFHLQANLLCPCSRFELLRPLAVSEVVAEFEDVTLDGDDALGRLALILALDDLHVDLAGLAIRVDRIADDKLLLV